MQGQQPELWNSKEGGLLRHPPLYQELTPDQRRQIVERLARLILKQAHNNTNTATEPNHER